MFVLDHSTRYHRHVCSWSMVFD